MGFGFNPLLRTSKSQFHYYFTLYIRFVYFIIMKLIILDNEDKVADWSARYIVKKINEFKPHRGKYFVLGLPTGKY